MINESALDKKTKELIALDVSLVNRCEYSSLAHETQAKIYESSDGEMGEVKKIVELFYSFNVIADSLKISCDVRPELLEKDRNKRSEICQK